MKKVCCVDIDGVLNYYPQPWLDFLRDRGYYFKDINLAKKSLSYECYSRLKREYRLSDEKKNMIPRENAVDFTDVLGESGYEVAIKTSRPITQFPHLIKWTHDWLTENAFRYREVVFCRYRTYQIALLYPHLDFVVDDDPRVISIFENLGIKAFLFDGNFMTVLENIG